MAGPTSRIIATQPIGSTCRVSYVRDRTGVTASYVTHVLSGSRPGTGCKMQLDLCWLGRSKGIRKILTWVTQGAGPLVASLLGLRKSDWPSLHFEQISADARNIKL